jgi:hypothetical protein
LCEVVCVRHFLDLWRERDGRAFDNTEKIRAAINMRATRDPKEESQQREKTLHAGYFS